MTIAIDQPPTDVASSSSYFSWRRDDVLKHVPVDTRLILSVGCGAGLTEEVLVRRGARVIGVEVCPWAAAAARERGVDVIEGDISRVGAELRGQLFDCLLYADVLEHLTAPEDIVSEHARLLAPGGIAIVSVPNFRNLAVLRDLFLRGEVVYRDAGILDRTHVRLTTRKMVARWFSEAGLQLEQVDYKINRRRDKLLSACLLRLPRELLASQVICVGRRS